MLKVTVGAPTKAVASLIRQIHTAYVHAVESVFEVGELCEAFAHKHKGQYRRACEEGALPFGRTTADRFRAIYRKLGAAVPTGHRSKLPASWRTLYELTQIPAVRIRELLESGEIGAETTREEVVRLRPLPRLIVETRRVPAPPSPICSRSDDAPPASALPRF